MIQMIKNLSKEALKEYYQELKSKYEEYKAMGLNLDMSRGKPCQEQLDLSAKILTVLNDSEDCISKDGTDCRNYGVLAGIVEAREMFAELFDVEVDETIVGGNSSLNMIYDTICRAMLFGVYGGEKPWGQQGEIKFLCPVPGYDRHFAICEAFGIKMINVPMTPTGPDMKIVKEYVESDPQIKGIWCVPKYSNPDGITYSADTVMALVDLEPAAPDFRIFWDNAYAVHYFADEDDKLVEIMAELKKRGKEDMLFMYTSTSKVSYPGAGVGAMAASKNNVQLILKQMMPQCIGPDKLNQLRHVRYFKDATGYKQYMKKHAAILRPRFETVLETLKRELGGEDIAHWIEPNGGYFVSLYVMEGCAKRVVSLLAEAGVKMTSAGATYPYGKDPSDSNIRIAPTYPTTDELHTAMDMLCLCVKMAAAEKLLEK